MSFWESVALFPPAPQADETVYEMWGEVINEVH